MKATSQILVVAALVMTLAAAIFDWKKGKIPNWISLPWLAVAPVLHAFAMHRSKAPFAIPGWAFGALTSIAGALLCGLVPYVFFRFKVFGGGDVKVLAAVGALLGPHWGLPAEFFALAAAAFYAPARLAFQGRLLVTIYESAAALVTPLVPRVRRRPIPDAMFEGIRLAPFVFLGTIASLGSSLSNARFLP